MKNEFKTQKVTITVPVGMDEQTIYEALEHDQIVLMNIHKTRCDEEMVEHNQTFAKFFCERAEEAK